MFINLSNHASAKWNEVQLAKAHEYGEIIDMPFPDVDPHGSSGYIDGLVEDYYNRIMKYDNPVVMLQGEYLFTYRLVTKLKNAGITVVAGCSERRTIEYVNDEGFTDRKSEFEFVDFKEY